MAGFARNRVLSCFYARHVDAHRSVQENAEFAAAARQVGRVGARYERLGRHATGIDARAAEVLAFDQRHLHAGSDEASHQRRPGLPGPDHDRIEIADHGSHPTMSLACLWWIVFMLVVPDFQIRFRATGCRQARRHAD